MSNQKTINKEAVFSGKGLQTGESVRMRCKPAGPSAGIVFKRTDLAGAPLLRLSDAIFPADRPRRSVISLGGVEVQTVEHFLAALWCLGIDNILVELDASELPAGDGSALEFITLLKQAGIADQKARRSPIKITRTERVEKEGSSLTLIPADTFSVSYSIDYDASCIGREVFDAEIDPVFFEKEIAPARTFCLKKEAEALLKAGFGKGADLGNTLVIDESGPVGSRFRFPDEPVRHKVLDLVGDLYMLGRPVIARVIAERSGHELNAGMMRRVYEKYVKDEG